MRINKFTNLVIILFKFIMQNGVGLCQSVGRGDLFVLLLRLVNVVLHQVVEFLVVFKLGILAPHGLNEMEKYLTLQRHLRLPFV